jgi:hypothetical protein
MPATFAYLLAAFAFVTVELLLLGAAMLMALIPKFRRHAKWIALGVPGSLVGVFASQLAALPIVLAVLWTFLVPVGYFHGGGQTTNPLVIAFGIGPTLVAIALFASVSLAGFGLGWGAANALLEGTPLRTFLESNRAWRYLSSPIRRPYRLPLLVWLVVVWLAFGLAVLRGWFNS